MKERINQLANTINQLIAQYKRQERFEALWSAKIEREFHVPFDSMSEEQRQEYRDRVIFALPWDYWRDKKYAIECQIEEFKDEYYDLHWEFCGFNAY